MQQRIPTDKILETLKANYEKPREVINTPTPSEFTGNLTLYLTSDTVSIFTTTEKLYDKYMMRTINCIQEYLTESTPVKIFVSNEKLSRELVHTVSTHFSVTYQINARDYNSLLELDGYLEAVMKEGRNSHTLIVIQDYAELKQKLGFELRYERISLYKGAILILNAPETRLADEECHVYWR